MTCAISKRLFSGTRAASGLAALMLWLAAGLVMPSSAYAWWNDDWSLRKKITIDASATGANITEPIGAATPVLVRLHLGNFRFQATKDDGSDLRFVLADDKTPLKYHIEKFDPLLGEALVWVSVPNLLPGAKTEIWLYFGNKKAVAVSDPKGTYDPDTLLDYHFNERGTPALDSTVWGNSAQSPMQSAEGAIIGSGLRLDGTNTLTLPAAPSLALADGAPFSWSAWIKPAALAPNAVIYSRRDSGNGLVIGLDNGVPYVEITRAGAVSRSNPGAPIAAGSWHHVAVAANATQTSLYLDGDLYGVVASPLPALTTTSLLGGDTLLAVAPDAAPDASAQPAAPDASATAPSAPAPSVPAPNVPAPSVPAAGAPAAGAATPAAPPAPAAPSGDATTAPAAPAAPAGSASAPAATAPAGDASAAAPAAAPAAVAPQGFVGDIDELQISKVTRPAGYIKFLAIEQGTDPAKLISFSVDEETSSWLTGYFAVILKSVTADGWVVIGLLMIMAVMSWVVMLRKASYLGKQAKANDQFMKLYRELTADLTSIDRAAADQLTGLAGPMSMKEAKALQASSLYRIYHIGAGELRRRFAGGNGRPVLSAAAIAAIRASLDSGVVKEMQNLNRLMVILTIAISGGPFLGLLGTVVGVMITFAAIAASGDVNVNAIAPGIAAALVATVAGLGVAIPALFGYNYLITRIRDLLSDIQVFVDELVTRMAELYAADRPDPVTRMAAE
jgi:biopolymer transport protein ExbB